MDESRLKSLPLFANVPDEELAQIAGFAQEVTVDQGRELVREGDFSYEFMAIEEGEAEVTREGGHVADLGAGDFFGEISLVTQRPRTATVTATSPVRALVITERSFKTLLEHQPEIQGKVMSALAARLAPDEDL